MDYIISSFFRLLCTIFTYENLRSSQDLRRKRPVVFYSSALLLYTLSVLVYFLTPDFSSLISIIAFYFFALYVYKDKSTSTLCITFISYGTFYALSNIFSLITALIFSPFYFYGLSVPYSLLIFTTGLLSFISLLILFKTKMTKNSVNIFTNSRFAIIASCLCILILIIKAIDQFDTLEAFTELFLPLATFLLAFLLFSWWRRQVTKSYIDKLRQLEIQTLYDELAEKDSLIKKLQDDNSSLSRIIHKDNKLIPAMEHAVTDFLLHNEFSDVTQMEIYGKDLSERLQNMSQDRKGILEAYEEKNNILHLTGNVSIDAILAYMHKRALANHISLECKHTRENVEYLLEKISEEDLSHLLSDLIENSLNAMSGLSSGRIVVTFGKLQKEAYLSIADTGDAFSIETLHCFGLQPHTTHESTGGSGIGLMDIWKIKKKYKASIQIQEFDSNIGSLTKKIIFSFNSKNHYVIQSYRCTDIINTQTRGDLYVIPADNTEVNGGKSA